MIGSVLNSLEEHGFAQLYLPTIAFGALFITQSPSTHPRVVLFGASESIYLIGFFANLVSTAYFKTFLEAVAGPITGNPNPVNREELMMRLRYTISNRGKPAQYPGDMSTPIWEADVDIPWYRVSLSGGMVITGAVVAVSFFYTTWKLSIVSLNTPDLILGSIAFVHLVFLFQGAFDLLWPDTYLEYAYKDHSLNRKLEELYSYIRIHSGLRITDGAYATDDGGTLTLAFTLDEETELEEALEFLLLGISGTVVPDEFPCNTFKFVDETEEENRAYTTTSTNIEGFSEGYLSMSELVQDAIDSTSWN